MTASGAGTQPGRWTRRQRDLAVSLWVSFLSACAGTFLLFALVDPEALTSAWVPGWELGLRLVYGIGFAFLFAVSLLASLLTSYMIRTGPPPGHAQRPPPTVRDPAELNPDLKDEEWR